jgi:hypothetical protein
MVTKAHTRMINGLDDLSSGVVEFRPGATLSNVNTAIAAANAGTGPRRLYFSAGTYTWSAAFTTITGNNIVIEGDGDYNGGTVFVFTPTSGDDITFSGAAHSGVRNIYFAPSVKKIAGYSIKLGTGFRCFVEDVRIDYGFNGIYVLSSTESRIRRVQMRQMLGIRGIQFEGVNVAPSYRVFIEDFICDNPPPASYGAANAKTWAISTAYVVGDVVNVNSNIYMCVTAGTSAGAGTGPSGVPGSTAPTAFTTTIADGTAAWKFVCANNLIWLEQGSYAYSLVVEGAALLNATVGFSMADGLATGTSYPTFAFFWDLEVDHPYGTGIQLSNGEGVHITGCWVSSSITGNGIFIGASHRGEVQVSDTRVYGNAQSGILWQAGPVDLLVSNCVIGDNSASGSALFDGFAAAASATRFVLDGNRIGDAVGSGGNNQRYGIFINTGASSYVLSNNTVTGNVTGGISPSGSGYEIRGNVGYVTQAVGTGSIGAASTSVTVAHGCASFGIGLADVKITPTSTWGTTAKWWASAIDATNITVNVDAAPGSTLSFSWGVDNTRG